VHQRLKNAARNFRGEMILNFHHDKLLESLVCSLVEEKLDGQGM
jgi:hypothetical protein